MKHDYLVYLEDMNVDLKIVWEVVKRDIPQYKPQLQRILAEEEG